MTVTGCCGHFVWTQSCCLRTVHIVQTIHAILKYCELSMQWQPCCCNYWQWVTISLQHTSHWIGWESVLSVPGNQQVTCVDILECSVYLGYVTNRSNLSNEAGKRTVICITNSKIYKRQSTNSFRWCSMYVMEQRQATCAVLAMIKRTGTWCPRILTVI